MTIMVNNAGTAGQFGKLNLQMAGNVSTWVSVLASNIDLKSEKQFQEYTLLSQSLKQYAPTFVDSSISGEMIIDHLTFIGNSAATAGTLEKTGLWQASSNGDKLKFQYDMAAPGETSGNIGATFTGNCYLGGITSTSTTEAPVYMSPYELRVLDITKTALT